MVDLKSEVKAALGAIEGVKAFFYFPDTFKELPCVSYYEALNAPDATGDDDEYASEIVYVADVWGASSAAVTNTALKVDAAMKAIGFTREFAYDVREPASSVRHKTMRFKRIAGA